MTKLGTAFFEVLPDTNSFSRQLKGKVDAAIASVGISPAAAAIGVGLGAAIVGGLGVAVASAAKFEKGLSEVRAVAGATEDQMEAVRAKALQLGADTAFSATQAAGAMEELVKAGLSIEQVLSGAADAAVSLAAAGGVSLETAATIAANALNSFSLGGDQITKVADIVAGAANASAIGVNDFALSLSQAGAVANLAGLSFGDTATAIALMGNAGIRGSDAGTSLKVMLQNLIPVTTREKNLFAELGIVTEEAGNKFFDAQGHVKSLAEISQVLQEATRGQTDQQKLYNLSILFGSDALRAAGILTKAGAAGVRELNAEMRETTAAEAAAIRMDNLAGSFEQFRGSLETVLITVGTPLQSGLRSVLDFGTGTLNMLGDLGAGGGLVADTFGDMAEVGKDLARLLGNVAEAGAPAVKVLVQLGGGAVLVGLNALADVLGPIASLLSENQVAADLLAAVLVGRLGLAVVGLIGTSGLAGLTTGLVTAGRTAVATGALMIQLEGGLGAAKAAALGMGSALKAIGPGIAISAAAYGLIQIQNEAREAREQAAALREEVFGAALGPSPTLDAIDKAYERTARQLTDLRNQNQKPQNVQDFLRATADIDTLEAGANDLVAVRAKVKENIAGIAKVTGLTDLGIDRLARQFKIDLSGPFTKTTQAVIARAQEMGQALLVSSGNVEKAIALTEAEAKAAEELAEGLASSFNAAANIAGQFTSKLNAGASLTGFFADQASSAKAAAGASKDLAQAAKGVRDAQNSEAEAGRQLNAARASGDADRVAREEGQLAQAHDRVSEALARQAEARGKVAEAQPRGGGLVGFFRTELAEARTFQDNIATLLSAGLDPILVRELAEQGPKAAGAAVQGALAEVRAGNTGAINETVSSLRTAQQAVKGQSLAFFREQLAEQQAFGSNLKKLVEAGLDPELVRKVALAGPEAGAGAAAALVADVGAGKVGELNASQAALRTGLQGIQKLIESYTGPLNVTTQKMFSDAFGGVTVDDPVAGIRADLARAFSPASLFSGVDIERLKAYATNVGSAIPAGIAAGIVKPDPAIAAGVAAITGGLVKSTKGRLGISSPSRVFADEIGGPIVAGIALGMREQMASVVAQAEAVVARAASVTVPAFDVPSLAGAVPLGGSSGAAAGAAPSTAAPARTGPMIEFTVDARGAQDPNEIAEAIDRKLGWRAANAAYEMPSS